MPSHDNRTPYTPKANLPALLPALPDHFEPAGTAALSFRSIDQGSLTPTSIAWAILLTLVLYIPIAFVIGYEVNRPSAYATFHPKQPPDDDANPIVRPKVVFSFSPAQFKPGETVTLTANVVALPGHPVPKGRVRFLIGYETLKFGMLSHGSVSVNAKISRAHLHDALRAHYLGDDYYNSSYSEVVSPQ